MPRLLAGAGLSRITNVVNHLLVCVLTLGAGREAVWRLAGDVTRPPCDPSDRTEVGHEGDDGGRTVECAPIRLADYPHPSAALARLQAFRAGLYACCTRRADALVDLADALLSALGRSHPCRS
jgi:hypothetical protein